MRPLSLILALAFVLAGLLTQPAPEARLPGIGTFSYSGSPIAADAPALIVVAGLR